MKKEFCTYEQSLALKELGFDLECLHSYELKIQFNTSTSYKQEYVTAPLIQQAFRFFREKYGLYGNVYIAHDSSYWYSIRTYEFGDITSTEYKTYEEAEQACLDKLIELGREQFKARQKELLTEMMRGDEELGLYDNEAKEK